MTAVGQSQEPRLSDARAKLTEGYEIQQRREALGLTKRELAHLSRVSVRTIGRTERGETIPGFLVRRQIFAALDTPLPAEPPPTRRERRMTQADRHVEALERHIGRLEQHIARLERELESMRTRGRD